MRVLDQKELEMDFRTKLKEYMFQYKLCKDENERLKIKESMDLLKREHKLQLYKLKRDMESLDQGKGR